MHGMPLSLGAVCASGITAAHARRAQRNVCLRSRALRGLQLPGRPWPAPQPRHRKTHSVDDQGLLGCPAARRLGRAHLCQHSGVGVGAEAFHFNPPNTRPLLHPVPMEVQRGKATMPAQSPGPRMGNTWRSHSKLANRGSKSQSLPGTGSSRDGRERRAWTLQQGQSGEGKDI